MPESHTGSTHAQINSVSRLFARFSIFLSSLCVIHCLATPFVLLVLPAMATFLSETFERILVLSVVPLSLIGFAPTWLRHKNNRLMILYILSISLILFSQFVLHAGHEHAAGESASLMGWLRAGTTFSGALLLAWVVFQNNRHTHYCTHPNHHQDTARLRPDHHDEASF